MRRVTDVMSTVECITMDSLMDVCQWKQENLRECYRCLMMEIYQNEQKLYIFLLIDAIALISEGQ